MQRSCRYIPLSHSTLVVVLAQVRFSPIRKIADFIPAIQEVFRKKGFPIEHMAEEEQHTITAGGRIVQRHQTWEYRQKEERVGIRVSDSGLLVQTVAYDRFEHFVEDLRLALETVFAETQHDTLGVVDWVGLRYINLIRPKDGRDYRDYLRPGLHGVSDTVFVPGTHQLYAQHTGQTAMHTGQGTFIVRVLQNDQGVDLPPDLVGEPILQRPSEAREGELVTLIDMSHFVKGRFDTNVDKVIETFYLLHDPIIENFHNHVVSPRAIEEWK